MSKLIDAVRTIRKELIIKDEPLKAWKLLEAIDSKELNPERDRTWTMINHVYDEDRYQEIYGMQGQDQIPNAELVEPRDYITNAGKRYYRYQWIVEEAERNKPSTYMDLACYVGSLVTTVANMGIHSIGVDMTERAIELAKERAKSAGIENCEFYVADATKFKKKKADMVSAFEVFEHVPDPDQFIEHLLSLVNKGGWCYITTPNGPFDNGRGNLGHWDIPNYRGHVRVFTKATLLKIMDNHNCEIGYLEGEHDGLLWLKFRRKEVSNENV